MSTTADAVARETAWLAGPAQTAGSQTIPPLAAVHGGPFDVVQAYLPRSQTTSQHRLYVTRGRIQDSRFAQQRTIATHEFRLYLYWKIGGSTVSTDIAEIEQQNLDTAIEAVRARIRGFVADHTHGGQFLSAAEGPPGSVIDVVYGDLAADIKASVLTATITYSADDRDQIG